MRWFKTRYVQFLETEHSRLLSENVALKKHIESLSERLLQRNGVPSVELPAEPSKEALDRMLQSNNIFDDVDDSLEVAVLTDNRKEKYDEFVG